MIPEIKCGLSAETQRKIVGVLINYPEVEKCLLYGSRAKGTFKTGSDIDLTLIAKNMDLSKILKVQNDLDDLLLPYKIDLSHFETLDNDNLIAHINRVGVVFYSKA